MADYLATAKAARAERQKEVEKSHTEYKERTKGNCTPTQEEADLLKRGVPLLNKEGGGAPEPATRPRQMETRQMEAGTKGEYTTRQSRAAQTAPAPAPTPSPSTQSSS